MFTDAKYRSLASLIAAALLGFAALVWSLCFADHDTRSMLVKEDGVVQMLSAFGYIACIAVIVAKGGFHSLVTNWYLPVLLLTMTMRELDLHSRFTTYGIFKTRFYVDADVPAAEKLAALAIIAVILTAAITLAKAHFSGLLKGLRQLKPSAIACASAALLVVGSKAVDGLARKLTSFGWELSTQVSLNAVVIEELLELAIPLMLILAVILSPSLTRQRGGEHIQPVQPETGDSQKQRAA